MRQFTGNQFQAISIKKKPQSYFSFLMIFLGIVSYSKKNVSCAAKVFLVYAVQLIAFKLPVKLPRYNNGLYQNIHKK